MEKVEHSTAAKEFELQQTITALQAEMAKNRETRQVLAKHIVSLEAQLNNRTDTGEFLASKISSLEVSLEETTVIMKEKEASLKTALDKITEEKDQAEQVCQNLRQEREDILEKFLWTITVQQLSLTFLLTFFIGTPYVFAYVSPRQTL